MATDLRAAPLFARSGSCFRIVEMHLRVGRMAGLFKPSRIAGRRFRRDDLGSNSKGHFKAAARVGRDLILCMSVSLDGFVARRDGVIDWLDSPGADSSGADRHRAVLELLGQIDTIVLGRGAYEEMSRGWPGSENPMGVLMNTLPKVVFSTSLDGVDWDNASLNRGAVQDEIPKLKQQPGRDIIAFGGARFAHALARYRLVDEYRLTVHPVALGDGLSLLHGLPEPQRLNLISSTVYPDGSVTQAFKAPV